MALENQNTIEGGSLIRKTRSKQNKNKKNRKYYLSFMTIVLLACVVQVSYSALLNISKIVIYKSKITKSQELKHRAELKNARLKNELENFNSMQKVESIARNNLKMAGENEVLVIINDPKAEEDKPLTKKEKLIKYFEKHIARKFVQNDSASSLLVPNIK